jgi:hypothetical protein
MSIRVRRIPRTLQPGGEGHKIITGTAAATAGAAGADVISGIGTAVSSLGFTSDGATIAGWRTAATTAATTAAGTVGMAGAATAVAGAVAAATPFVLAAGAGVAIGWGIKKLFED